MQFSHLHSHTQYSLLDGAAGIRKMLAKAAEDEMPAAAITDHGNMFGVFEFVNEANKAGVKPIIGCEFYMVEDRHQKQFTKESRDKRYHQLLLAKTQDGYKNLMKLCSLGFIEGLYSKYPRIDKELLEQYHEGIIATTCCIGAEVPQAIINHDQEKAEKLFKWYLDLFGEDYYVELQRHGLEDINGSGLSQEDINQILIGWAKKYDVKVIATNDSHYIEQDDFYSHDVLLCVNTGVNVSVPKGDGKGFRFGFANDEFFFKNQSQMSELFKDIPEAVDNTMDIVSKCYDPKLSRDILLPEFGLPTGFNNSDEYLKHLAYEGAKMKYGELGQPVVERLDHELGIINEMGFSGYFLITQDFIKAARDMGVAVGPGRGSAAGSAVAYAVGITNIDPIRYKLLFERFLNPERISMPDIDTDFDDEGRQKVIDYTVEKYGKNQVAQIITYGTMAAKSSIRDVSRVMDLPLQESDKLAKLVPATPGMTLQKAYKESPELADIRKDVSTEQGKVLEIAERLEGTVRNTGIHAAGVIIAPDDITKYIPVSTAKDSDLFVTQFDGRYIEDAGMLKMDFLGLKTLTIIKDAIALVEQNHGVKIDPDEIPLDDEKTLKLYQNGDTVGTFQFESDGMRKYLRELKPSGIEDLIAMNALYRPGPMDYIPSFVARRHGREDIDYPHELLKPILEDTYGIMVYQEQIMQTAQIMAGYSLGQADLLRRAMGKKKFDVMEQQKQIFIDGANKIHNVEEEKAKEVFDIMIKFAAYGFNRSHSAAYSVVAFQTGYLKANYPAEYMAAVLTNNMNDIKKVTYFIEECRHMSIPVLGPDVNESFSKFAVNAEGEIRFGMAAVKGVGTGAVEAIVSERNETGKYVSLFDFTKRVNLKAANKKTLESLASCGAFDDLNIENRSQLFATNGDSHMSNLELAIKFGNSYQINKDAAQTSLFGESSDVEIPEPVFPPAEPWGKLQRLKLEKEYTGLYISGHPLDEHKLDLDRFTTHTIEQLQDLNDLKGKDIKFGGVLTEVQHRTSQKGTQYARFTIEDYSGALQLALFTKLYVQFKNLLETDWQVFVEAKVENRWNSEELELRVKNIRLLSEIREQYIKSFKIELNADQQDEAYFARVKEAIAENEGGTLLQVKLLSEHDNKPISFSSNKIRVKVTNDLLKRLEDLQIQYHLN